MGNWDSMDIDWLRNVFGRHPCYVDGGTQPRQYLLLRQQPVAFLLDYHVAFAHAPLEGAAIDDFNQSARITDDAFFLKPFCGF
ncbi:hypothetical protein FEP41_04287 [Burkholderia multivorans]|nr:hypothetical protein [Burkholderia multivorans]